jgi:triosephosphate isomerase
MNGTRELATALASAIAEARVTGPIDVVVCPPAPYLERVAEAVAGSGVAVGAQDCSEFEPGARTGETAVAMLADVGCAYVIVGHSERRQQCGEDDARVAAKAVRASAGGLVPIVCVGETLEERRRGATEVVVGRQLDALLTLADARAVLARAVLAYEPVWAIGTGESATPAQAQAVHAFVRARVRALDAGLAEGLRVLYGGSVKPDNARELFAMPDIDGGLIGGASLAAESFLAICRAAMH